MNPDERKPWEQQPGEPTIWYGRFHTYLLAGSDRSLHATYIAWRTAAIKRGKSKPIRAHHGMPKTWQTAQTRWTWRERADAFDRCEIERKREEFEEERLRDREIRRQILQAGRRKMIEALQRLDPDEAKWSDVATWLRMLNEEQRIELDDQPSQRQEIVGDGKTLSIEVTYSKKDSQIKHGTSEGEAKP